MGGRAMSELRRLPNNTIAQPLITSDRSPSVCPLGLLAPNKVYDGGDEAK